MKKLHVLSLVCALELLAGVPAAQAQVNIDSLEAVYDSLELSGVTVTAAKPMVKMEADKMSYDVQADADAQSSTVLDMLRKVPMVTVDGQDNITVNGSSAFKVYVDGKPNPMLSQNPSQVLKMMPAAAVKKIEVITNPGARYDAEGAVGVLNLVLNKQPGGGAAGGQSLDGLSGTVRAGVSTKGAGGGVFFSAQQGKLSASGNALFQYQQMKDTEVSIDRQSLADGTRMQYEQSTTQRVPFTMGNLSLGYDLDSLNTLTASLGLTAFRAKVTDAPLVTLTGSEGNPLSYSYDMATRMRNTSLTASADWQHFFSADRQHSLTLSYLLSYAPQKTSTEQLYTDFQPFDFYSENKPRSLEQTLQLDYVRPLSPGHTLSLGGKYIMRDNRSWAEDRNVPHADGQSPQTSYVEYRHDNDIAAAYAEYAAQMGIVGAKAGLRYEHTFQKVSYLQGAGADFRRDYGNLVPSLTLSLSPKPTKNLGLTYNMRLSRPGISYLNPYVDRTAPTSISYGNSYLDVEKTHNLGATFSSFSQKFMLNVGLHQALCGNQIAQYSFMADGVLNNTYGNIARQRNTSLTAFVNWLLGKNTRLILNGGLSYVDLRTSDDASIAPSFSKGSGSVAAQKNHGWQGNVMAGLQQTLPWQLQLSANVIANSKTYTLQGWQSGFQVLVASLSKSLLGDRLNVSLSAITGLHDGGSISIDSYSAGRDFTHRQHIRVPMSQLQLNLSYTFGKKGVQTREHKSRIENDFLEKKSDQEQISNTSSGM